MAGIIRALSSPSTKPIATYVRGLRKYQCQTTTFRELPEIIANHRQHHEDPLYNFTWRKSADGTFRLATDFYKEEVVVRQLKDPPANFVGHLIGTVQQMRETEVATLHLQNVLGSSEASFCTEGASYPTLRDGYARTIAWDVENDQLIGTPKVGPPIVCQGTNFIEFAILVTKASRELRKPKYANIPHGIGALELRIGRQEGFSMAASPLQIIAGVNSPLHHPATEIEWWVEEAVAAAVHNQIVL